MNDEQFTKVDILLTDSDLENLSRIGYLDCNIEISLRIKLDKFAKKLLKSKLNKEVNKK